VTATPARFPLLATLLVLLAVGIMARLGLWQLDRLHQKEALLARYASASAASAPVAWPRSAPEIEATLYRRGSVACASVRSASWKSGVNASGEAGLARYVECRTPEGGTATVVLGWARQPTSPDWRGGEVRGTIAPGPRLVADPPLAGLQANVRPDPATIPNNHLSYAVQWFLFALTALVIYAIALWRRLRA
jgi:surfeit locus 1 family protein